MTRGKRLCKMLTGREGENVAHCGGGGVSLDVMRRKYNTWTLGKENPRGQPDSQRQTDASRLAVAEHGLLPTVSSTNTSMQPSFQTLIRICLTNHTPAQLRRAPVPDYFLPKPVEIRPTDLNV